MPTSEAVIRFPQPLLAALVALLTGSTLVLAAPAPAARPADARRAPAASLSASPGNGSFTAGQELTLTGAIGRPGRRTVHLESNLGRPGDRWRDVPGITARTTSSGRFTLEVRAHSSQITYRVAGGSRRTPSWTSNAVFQEVTLTANRSAVAGQPLTLVASTTAMPLLEGRVLTLQQRIGTSWTTITTSSVGPDGRGSFLVEPTGAGQTVYRVRAEDWDRGVGHVGWFPSYPLYVDVAAAGSTSTRLPPSAQQRSVVPTRALTKAPPHQVTAAGSRRWGIQRYDFDWEYGESLTDRAEIGSNRRGSWLDTSTGTGRVMMRNGAMQLSSNSEGAGRAGSTGSLSATLQGNVQTYGRWETRAMPMVFAGGSTDYVLRAELLPQADVATGCDSRSITLFETRPSTPGVTIGAHAPGGVSWQRTLDVTTQRTFHAYAVEVTPKKITWFVDGRPVGRVTDAAAISGQPLTVRITMAASGSEPMRTTRTLVDWVRAYSPDKGIPTRGGTRMSASSYAPTC